MPVSLAALLLFILSLMVFYLYIQKRNVEIDRQKSYNTTLEVVCTICTEMFKQDKFDSIDECQQWLLEKSRHFNREGLKGISSEEARMIARKAKGRAKQ